MRKRDRGKSYARRWWVAERVRAYSRTSRGPLHYMPNFYIDPILYMQHVDEDEQARLEIQMLRSRQGFICITHT